MRAKSYSLFFKTGCTHARNHVLLLSSNHNYNKIFLIWTVGFQLQLEIKEQGCSLHKQEKNVNNEAIYLFIFYVEVIQHHSSQLNTMSRLQG